MHKVDAKIVLGEGKVNVQGASRLDVWKTRFMTSGLGRLSCRCFIHWFVAAWVYGR